MYETSPFFPLGSRTTQVCEPDAGPHGLRFYLALLLFSFPLTSLARSLRSARGFTIADGGWNVTQLSIIDSGEIGAIR